MGDIITKQVIEKCIVPQVTVAKWCRNNLISEATQNKKRNYFTYIKECYATSKEKNSMLRKLGTVFFILTVILCMMGCNSETDEEILQREIRESEKRVIDSITECNDTQKTVNDYNKYRNAV